MRCFLDTQLYSYLANGTIARSEWRATLARRELWLSPITAYELLEGLLNASPHTYPMSLAALAEAADVPAERTLAFPGPFARQWKVATLRRWLKVAGRSQLPKDFYEFRRRVTAGREKFLGQIRRFMAAMTPHHRSLGDPLFVPEWRARAGRKAAEKLEAAFVLQTAVLERALRIRYNPEKHPSDYLDYLQLQYLDAEDLAFVTADRKLAAMTSRSLQSDRILLWEELRKVKSDE